MGDYLFTDADFIKHLSTEHRNIFQKIYDEIKYLCKIVTAGTKEARQLEKVKKAFADAYRAETKNPTAEGGTKYSLNIKHTDGSVEVLADARNLTTEQAVSYLQQAKAGSLQGGSYIPVRKDTPQVIVDTLSEVGERVENLSLVMQVRKAQQAMSPENPGGRRGKHGSNVRKHALNPQEIVEIVNNLDDPTTIILQTNRQNKNGDMLPNNVAVFVEYSKNNSEGRAVIEFESSINPEFIGTEFGEVNYHTVVTVFEPDIERDGMPFDYAEELLSNPNNIELDIKRRQPKGSATGANQPNTSNELPYGNSIRNPNGEVNNKNSLSKKDFSIAPPVGADVRGQDIGYDIVPPVPESVLRANKARPKVGDPAYAPIAEGYLPKVNPEDSTGAAPSGFDPVSHLQYEYGSLPEGEKPVREDSLPKSTNGKDKVSLTARTVKGAEATPDALVDLLDKTVVEGGLSYIPLSNDATVQKAYDRIRDLGWEEALEDWKADVRAGKGNRTKKRK